MAVSSGNNALQPTGITGPPEIMSGRVQLAGDASAGLSLISFTLDAGFLWMPSVASISINGSNAFDYEFSILDIEDTQAAGNAIIGASIFVANPTTTNASSICPNPRVLFKTVNKNGTIRVQTPNVNGQTTIFYVRMLRWEKNSPPPAWQAYLVAPP